MSNINAKACLLAAQLFAEATRESLYIATRLVGWVAVGSSRHLLADMINNERHSSEVVRGDRRGTHLRAVVEFERLQDELGFAKTEDGAA